jgi:molybdopterin synthase catalytic subunit
MRCIIPFVRSEVAPDQAGDTDMASKTNQKTSASKELAGFAARAQEICEKAAKETTDLGLRFQEQAVTLVERQQELTEESTRFAIENQKHLLGMWKKNLDAGNRFWQEGMTELRDLLEVRMP